VAGCDRARGGDRAFAVAFHFVGFAVPPRPVSYWTSLLYAFRATLSLTDDQVKLTAWGQLLRGVLRLTGPVLLSLALFALRGRVKRRATRSSVSGNTTQLDPTVHWYCTP
jgi:hypothetical protein